MADPWAQFKDADAAGDPWAQFGDVPEGPPPTQADTAKDALGKQLKGSPKWSDYLQANPVVGAPFQTLLRAGQGMEQLLATGAAFTGIPGAQALSDRVNRAIESQNAGYEGAKQRLISASNNPRLQEAFTNTGEVMGNMLNPAGAAGVAIPYAPGMLNAGIRGLASGAGYGASQPVADTNNFWKEKAKQVALGGGMGALTGALTERLTRPQTPPIPTTQDLKSAGSAKYQQVGSTPVPVTQDMVDAVNDKFGRTAITKAIQGAEANRETALANELKSLLVDDPANLPTQISAEAADKVSRAFRTLGSNAMRTDENIARGWFGRRADVEDALTAVPEIKDARGLWARYEKGQIIEDTIKAAQDTMNTPAGTGGYDQALRREFGKLVRDDRLMSGFSEAEKDAIKKVSVGTFTGNALQRLGKFSPVRNHLAAITELLTAGTAHIAGSPGISGTVLAAAAGGEAARLASTAMTNRNALLASQLVRSGGVLPPPVQQTGNQALVDLLLRAGSNAAISPFLRYPVHPNAANSR